MLRSDVVHLEPKKWCEQFNVKDGTRLSFKATQPRGTALEWVCAVALGVSVVFKHVNEMTHFGLIRQRSITPSD